VSRGDHTSADHAEQAALIHREVLQLIILMLVAVAGFFVTRAVAANNRAMSLRDAAAWYTRGQQALQAGRVDAAIQAFRRATLRNRYNKEYVLALARALAANHDDDSARSVLLALRESAPENVDINLELARLAAHRQDVTEALRFYRNALYAPWAPELQDTRRSVRLELIRFLLTHDQSDRALSELLAVASDLPDDLAAHVQVGQLFAGAGDYAHSLDQFRRALHLDGGNAQALTGAGESAFHLGQYAVALAYFRRAPDTFDDVAASREVAERVLADDPLANRIGATERRRRLTSDLAYARERLAACTPGASGQTPDDRVALAGEGEDLATRLEQTTVLDLDTIEAGADVVARMTRYVAQTCGSPTPRDRALILIGRQHAGVAK